MSPKHQENGELAWSGRERYRILDRDVKRVDGPVKVTGRARYTHDVRLEGMLYGRILTCPYPVAVPKIDLEPARAIDGVVAAIELDGSRDEGATVYLGQPIAAVAARTPELAEDAIRALVVDYGQRDWVVTREQAIEDGAPPITERGNRITDDARGDLEETEAALADCDAVVEATYTMPVQTHACMETHGAVVEYRGGDEAIVYSSSQFTSGIPRSAARPLELQTSQVVGLVEHMGGGFGSKLSFGVAGLAACRLSKETGAPVHLMLTREQDFQCTGNRSGSHQVMRGGADRDGTFVALDTRIENLGGLGRGSHPGQPYLYQPETYHTVPGRVHTNTNASVPMRAPGRPQASFAIESMVDELAHAVGFDPLEFRKKNLEDEVYHRQLDRVAKEIGWLEHEHRTGPPAPADLPEKAIGIGFGVGAWDVPGRPGSQATVRIATDGSVVSSAGSQDLGTGTRTYLAGIVAEELGLPIEAVEVRIGDSRLGPAGASGGSMTVPSLAPAILDAVTKAKRALFERVAPLMETTADRLRSEGEAVFDADDPSNRLAWKAACAALASNEISETGEFRAELATQGVHGAQAAKVEVDTLTGEVRVLKMVAIQDCGIPLNRLATRSQIQGAMIGSLSYGLLEERVIDPEIGVQINAQFVDYKVAGIREMPEFVAIIDEDPRQQVVGVGEPPVVPGQSAIANAIFNACGARVRDLPLTPDRVITAIADLREEG